MKKNSLDLTGIMWFTLPYGGYIQLRSITNTHAEVYFLDQHDYELVSKGFIMVESELVLDDVLIGKLEMKKREHEDMYGTAKPILKSKPVGVYK